MGKVELKETLSSPSASLPIKCYRQHPEFWSRWTKGQGHIVCYSWHHKLRLSNSKKTRAMKKLGHGFRDSADGKGRITSPKGKRGKRISRMDTFGSSVKLDTKNLHIEDHDLGQNRRKLKKSIKNNRIYSFKLINNNHATDRITRPIELYSLKI